MYAHIYLYVYIYIYSKSIWDNMRHTSTYYFQPPQSTFMLGISMPCHPRSQEVWPRSWGKPDGTSVLTRIHDWIQRHLPLEMRSTSAMFLWMSSVSNMQRYHFETWTKSWNHINQFESYLAVVLFFRFHLTLSCLFNTYHSLDWFLYRWTRYNYQDGPTST